MATSYDDIYDRFLAKITDYELANMDTPTLETNLLKYLKAAIPKFKYCEEDLTDRDDVTKTFTADLTEEEQEILALLMRVEWLSPNIYRLENIRQNIGDKDFRIYSPSNHLQKLKDLKQDAQSEIDSMSALYYYSSKE